MSAVMMMKYILLDLQSEKDIAIIKINRPEVLNALNKEVMSELSTAIDIVGPAKTKELIYTGKMITAYEAERIGLVNKVVSLTPEDELSAAEQTTTAKILNRKLMDECLTFAKEITKNSFAAVKTSKMLIN